jgi:hypothetical protein
MPAKKKGATAVRTAAGLAPLALALLLNRSVLPGGTEERLAGVAEPAACEDDIEGVRGCHMEYPTGCSKAARYDAYLNLLKNQLPAAGERPIRALSRADFAELDKNTPVELTKGNHADFKDQLAKLGEGRLHTTIAYLYYAQNGGGSESSNCQLSDADAIDFHVGIGFDAKLADAVKKKRLRTGKLTDAQTDSLNDTSIVVEMTPHYRLRFKPDWTLDAVRAATGRQVKVTGILLVDNEHNNTKDNCALGNKPGCWRASTWELHPVTQFLVCRTDTPCAEDSNDWVELGETIDEKTPPTR